MIEALVFPLLSNHISETVDHRGTHPGVIAEFRVGEGRYGVGAYRNSFDKTTITVLRRLPNVVKGPITVGASFGICTGYRNRPVCGFGSVELYERLTLIIAPSTQTSKGVLILAWRQPLNR